MDKQNLEQAKQYALQRLQKELSPGLYYHGLIHTTDDVVPATEKFAAGEGIIDEDLDLLLTAAWFHDLGYVQSSVYHQLVSARIAVEVLPSFGFRSNEVEIVRWAILATALPQYPGTPLEEILVDADLDILGSKSFMRRNGDLRRGLENLGKQFTDEQWYSSQLKFLKKHEYFTASARTLRSVQKKKEYQ